MFIVHRSKKNIGHCRRMFLIRKLKLYLLIVMRCIRPISANKTEKLSLDLKHNSTIFMSIHKYADVKSSGKGS